MNIPKGNTRNLLGVVFREDLKLKIQGSFLCAHSLLHTSQSLPLSVKIKEIWTHQRQKVHEDKLIALKAYRRAKSLCYKCGEK